MAKPSRVAGPFTGNVLELILVSLPDLRRSDRRVAEHVWPTRAPPWDPASPRPRVPPMSASRR